MRLDASNKPGVLARTATIVSDEGADIEDVHLEDRDGFTTTITYQVSLQGRDHLAKIMRRLRKAPNVMKIWRV